MLIDELPSLKKLKDDIESMRTLSFFTSKIDKNELMRQKKALDNIVNQFEKFNSLFSDKGWCVYDSMSVSLVEEVNKTYDEYGIEKAENILINYYHTDVQNILHWLKGKSKELAERYELIEKAFEDHVAGRYHSSIPIFLIIADGAVNDYTKRKGFWSDKTDVGAWDCLVGSSQGLQKLKDIFNESRKKTNFEEIRLPYRNGILHGRDINYANKYVSSKALALLFVIADWMSMDKSEENRKQKLYEELNSPPIKESIKRIIKNQKNMKLHKEWKERIIIVGKTIPKKGNIIDYEGYPYV